MLRFLCLMMLALPAYAGYMGSFEHGSTGNKLRFPLYDFTGPESCPATAITASTSGLEIHVSTDVSAGYEESYTQSGSTIETVTTIGTYEAPTASNARFEVITGSACEYELHLANALFATVGAKFLTVEITDGGTAVMDAHYTWQLNDAGASLSAIPWNAAWDTEVESEATDALNAYDPPTKSELDTGFAGQNDISTTEVNAEILDVLTVDTFQQPASVLSSTPTLADILSWLGTVSRNKTTQNATTQTLRNDADSATIGTRTVTEDGVTTTLGEYQ